jgi:hypothetical protein
MVPAAADAMPVTLAFWSGKGQATAGKEHTMSVIAYWDAWMLQIGPGLDGRPADLDYDAADELLAEHNHRRVEPWHASGGQWAAEVERIDGRE